MALSEMALLSSDALDVVKSATLTVESPTTQPKT
jgi:hypothetical protein